MDTWTFYPGDYVFSHDSGPCVFVVKAPSWFLAKSAAMQRFQAVGGVSTWEHTPRAKPHLTISYRGTAASNPSTLEIVEKKR